MITENGLGAYDELTEDGKIHDEYRIDYLRAHIKAMKKRWIMELKFWLIVHGQL